MCSYFSAASLSRHMFSSISWGAHIVVRWFLHYSLVVGPAARSATLLLPHASCLGSGMGALPWCPALHCRRVGALSERFYRYSSVGRRTYEGKTSRVWHLEGTVKAAATIFRLEKHFVFPIKSLLLFFSRVARVFPRSARVLAIRVRGKTRFARGKTRFAREKTRIACEKTRIRARA
jgi:hypothetical protein